MKRKTAGAIFCIMIILGLTYFAVADNGGYRTIRSIIDDLNVSTDSPELVDGAVSVDYFNTYSEADYYNPENGIYYSDKSMRIKARDDTHRINKTIKYASERGIEAVYIPEGNYLIRAKGNRSEFDYEYAVNGGIQLESGVELRMAEGAVLVTNTVDANGYSLITVNNKSDVKISGGKIVGDKDTHPEGKHNYCYGITVCNGSENVTIENVEITKCENDGIMIADYSESLSGGVTSNGIEIKKVKSHGNGRQGLTISAGSNIKVVDSEFSNQNKYSPMSGIDIELESYLHQGVQNVEIVGNKFIGNGYSGIVLSDMFNEYPDSMSKDISIVRNTVSGSRFGFIIAGKADGLNIYDNDIYINHGQNEFSAGIGSTSVESKNVVIENNRIFSNSDRGNYSIGIIITTPGVSVLENALDGQKYGIVLYGQEAEVLGNIINGDIHNGIEDSVEGDTIEDNELR